MFLPLVGSLIYIFTEIIKKNEIDSLQYGFINFINPAGRIKKLENNFKFSDTLTNRLALANIYLRTGDNEKAVALYEPALIGLYHDNEDIIKHLAEAYYNLGRYGDVIKIIPKVTGSLFFSKSRANLFYAMSLEKKGNMELAEKEFKAMNHRFSNYESRYHYVKFLLRSNRKHEAEALMKEILNEDGHMSRKEKENDKIWIDKVKVEWKVLQT